MLFCLIKEDTGCHQKERYPRTSTTVGGPHYFRGITWKKQKVVWKVLTPICGSSTCWCCVPQHRSLAGVKTCATPREKSWIGKTQHLQRWNSSIVCLGKDLVSYFHVLRTFQVGKKKLIKKVGCGSNMSKLTPSHGFPRPRFAPELPGIGRGWRAKEEVAPWPWESGAMIGFGMVWKCLGRVDSTSVDVV